MVALWISVSKVAERLGIDKAEVRQQLRDRGLPTRVTESNRVEVLVAPPGTPNQDFHGALMAVRQEAERRRESAAAAAEAVEAASERILADLKRDRRIRRYILVGALAVFASGPCLARRADDGGLRIASGDSSRRGAAVPHVGGRIGRAAPPPVGRGGQVAGPVRGGRAAAIEAGRPGGARRFGPRAIGRTAEVARSLIVTTRSLLRSR